MISVRGIEKAYGRVRAVQGVSFEAPPGQVLGLLGANGAGKTTTIRMITGYFPPDRGRVAIGGHDTVEQSAEARRLIGYLPESAPSHGEMAVEAFLHFRGRLYGMRRPARREAIGRVLDRCRLADVRRRRIGHLSKGYRQRVGLAAAMLHDPPVLILDEPTNALDPAQIQETRRLIRELAERRTVLVSSHILPEVERTCDRVIILVRGRVRVDGRPDELLAALRQSAPYVVEIGVGDEAGLRRTEALLRALPGVARVEVRGLDGAGWARLELAGAAGAGDLRERVAAAAAGAGLLVRELRRQAPGLERVFLDLLESDGVDQPSGAAA